MLEVPAARFILLHFSFFILPFAFISCSFSPPASPAGSKLPPMYIIKFVPYAQDDSLKAYFTMADSRTNQVAADGRLKIQVYTTTSLSLGAAPPSEPTPGGMTIKNVLYDNTFAIGATNFHWESYGTFLTVKDLSFHFVIPYAHFKKPVRRGRVATLMIEFHPDGTTNVLAFAKNVSLY